LKITLSPGAQDTNLPVTAHFLEHVLIPDRSPEVVVGDGDGRVHVSRDAGASFATVSSFQRSVSKCFTLRGGRRLIRLKDSAETILCSGEFELLTVPCFASAEWHGSWSIAESPAGIVMFCEYVASAEFVRVWRSSDGGGTWGAALCATSLAAEPAVVAEVRHFHTCTWVRGSRWVVSSGDEARHCRIWLSDDDGLSWTELSDWHVAGAHDVPARYRKSILRHTAEFWDGDIAYWVTDDLLHRGRSAFVRADISGRRLDLLTDLGGNEMRTLVRHGDRFVAISESKHDPTHAKVYVLSRRGELLHEQKIANARGQKLSFTRSRSSREAVDGTFFTFDDGILSEKCRFIRWQIDE
jgi:hypothetical protein